MKALLLNAPRDLRQVDVDEPTRPGPGEALVRVHSVGICGTDLGGYLGKMPFFSYPRIPGHELGVEIVEVGPGVTNVRPGDRCAVEPYINCQECPACRRGKTNCCEKHQTLGVHCDGGLRPRFLVPARKLHVSRSLAFEQLALVETLAIGCHAVDRVAPRADGGSRGNGRGRIVGLIEEGKIDTKPWITHRARFEDLPGQFPSYTRPETGVIKAVVEVG
jgi:threonine dehydrogenase-like Zn-dependent dehydrogenase